MSFHDNKLLVLMLFDGRGTLPAVENFDIKTLNVCQEVTEENSGRQRSIKFSPFQKGVADLELD